MKTEHNGAKNGGGFWGKREEAKRLSKRARRAQGKAQAKDFPELGQRLYDRNVPE